MTTPPNHNTADQSGADERLESLIESSDGKWHDDEFRINGRDLMTLLRSASTQPAPVPAAFDLVALGIARRFTLDTEPQRRAALQCAIVTAMQAATPQPSAPASLRNIQFDGADDPHAPALPQASGDLPELPSPKLIGDAFTADQMRDYARSAIAAQPAQAPVGIIENAYFSASTEELTRADIVINGETVTLYAAPPTQAIAEAVKPVHVVIDAHPDIFTDIVDSTREEMFAYGMDGLYISRACERAVKRAVDLHNEAMDEAFYCNAAPSQGAKQNG